jgi:hypothetical protein
MNVEELRRALVACLGLRPSPVAVAFRANRELEPFHRGRLKAAGRG